MDQETERAAVAIQGKARLPGFRPGKAPLSIVKTRFAGDIRQEVLEALVPRFFQAAVEKDNLQLVGRPDISDVHFHAGEPLRFKAEFEVAPTFDLGEYRGVTITYNEPEVTDADVDARVEQIRDQKAQYVNEEPRALADGDYAVVSLESLEGVEEKVSQDELMLKIGDEATMKEFSENLRGASPEDVREFERHLSGGLRSPDAGRKNREIPRGGEGRPPQGTAGAERRVRQGSGRLQDARRAARDHPQIDPAGARAPRPGRSQAAS